MIKVNITNPFTNYKIGAIKGIIKITNISDNIYSSLPNFLLNAPKLYFYVISALQRSNISLRSNQSEPRLDSID